MKPEASGPCVVISSVLDAGSAVSWPAPEDPSHGAIFSHGIWGSCLCPWFQEKCHLQSAFQISPCRCPSAYFWKSVTVEKDQANSPDSVHTAHCLRQALCKQWSGLTPWCPLTQLYWNSPGAVGLLLALPAPDGYQEEEAFLQA